MISAAPVMLPEHPRAEDVDHVRFAQSGPGYHRGQVDATLARLLALRDDETVAVLVPLPSSTV